MLHDHIRFFSNSNFADIIGFRHISSIFNERNKIRQSNTILFLIRGWSCAMDLSAHHLYQRLEDCGGVDAEIQIFLQKMLPFHCQIIQSITEQFQCMNFTRIVTMLKMTIVSCNFKNEGFKMREVGVPHYLLLYLPFLSSFVPLYSILLVTNVSHTCQSQILVTNKTKGQKLISTLSRFELENFEKL